MNSLELVYICLSAFSAVFILLAFLAFFMRIISWIFPDHPDDEEEAVYAAIASVYQTRFPGTKITKIEELK